MNVRDDRLTGLDFLRTVACLLVFTHHTFQRLNFDAMPSGWREVQLFFNMGAFGVGIFFLLSGFLLARPFWVAFDSGAPMPSLRTYFLRRAARIMPGFYLSLLVSLLVAMLVFGTPLTGELLLRFVTGVFFVNEFHPVTLFPTEINGPLWSIGMEVFSYALLPIGLAFLFAVRGMLPGWRGRLGFALVILVALLGHYVIVTTIPPITEDSGFGHGMIGGAKFWIPKFNPVGFFVVFAMGSLTAGLSLLWRGRRNIFADLLAVAGLFVAGWTMWSLAPGKAPESFGWLSLPYDFPWFQSGIVLALLAFPHARVLPRFTESAPVAYIAKISFGIYIWHFLILELMRQLFAPTFGYSGIADTNYWTMLTTIGLVLAILAGTLSWYFVEFPALRWAKRLERNLQSEPPSDKATRNLHA
jgi:peptidoglycan/LPS O-acetylase OafA/YrhL